ncbi:MAG: DUF3800 domain-containing protein [Alphaproteobacteria bacterium]
MMKDKYRIYIDESGDHRYSTLDDIPFRYLCLSGVIIHNDIYEKISTEWEEIRNLFIDTNGHLPNFHLIDVINGKGIFSKLKNDINLKNKFDKIYLDFLSKNNMNIISVVLDKTNHKNRYLHPYHPYHYTLNVLLERYVRFLIENNKQGDVMIEQRGKHENQQLRKTFENFYNKGTDYSDSNEIQKVITTNKIKERNKKHRICGLEICDMITTILKFYVLYQYGIIDKLSNNFGLKVLETINNKILKDTNGHQKGYGIKLIR